MGLVYRSTVAALQLEYHRHGAILFLPAGRPLQPVQAKPQLVASRGSLERLILCVDGKTEDRRGGEGQTVNNGDLPGLIT